ncbi:MAG: hypothetical protein BroJett040_07510 [Oligoflexia bacterium]|nr:MAG: hypothetical protein BroJett040_07510 [Oligoflexia bacterium]
MSKRYDLTVEPRETGRHNSRTLRTKKLIPAVIYGSTENKNVCIAENTVVKYNTRAFENALFNIKSDDKALNGVVVLMKEVVVHPVSRRPEHIDLFALDLKKTVRVNIEVRFEGKPIGLSEGGLLNIVNRQIEIECLPTEIPEGITADVTNLGVGDALHVSDLTLPKGFKLISSPEMTLAVVNVLEEEAAATPAAEAAAAAPAAGAAAPAAGAAAPAAAGAKAPAAPAKDKK